MKAELLEMLLKGQTQTMKMNQAYLFLKSCPLSSTFTPQRDNQRATATAEVRTKGHLISWKPFQKCSELKNKGLRFFFQSLSFQNHK